jgi:hypothetical protein
MIVHLAPRFIVAGLWSKKLLDDFHRKTKWESYE